MAVNAHGECFADAAGGAQLPRVAEAGQQLGWVEAGALGAVQGGEEGRPGELGLGAVGYLRSERCPGHLG
jgi:hypothetical protein